MRNGHLNGQAEVAIGLLDEARVRLRVNAVAWHTQFHYAAPDYVEFEDCTVKACTNDRELLDRMIALLAEAEKPV